jgi:cation diffusion facilitator family transporter
MTEDRETAMREQAETAPAPPDSAMLERAALLSVLVTAGLGILKGAFAALSGSVGLLAEAVHSGADTLASAAVLAGLKISRRRSPAFPYGLYKVENLVALVVAGLIFVAAYGIGRNAISVRAHRLTYIAISAAGLVVAILVTIALARYKMRIGRAFNSPSLIADAQHSSVDVLSSAAVLVGLVGAWFGLPLDRIAALVVLVFIIRVGWLTLVDAVRVLLDASVDRETIDRIRAIIQDEHSVREIVQLAGRNSGRYRFIEADVVLRVRELEKAARIAARIEHRIREQVSNVDHVALRCEPLRKEVWRYAVPLEDPQGSVSRHFGEAPFFALVDASASDRRVLAQTVVDNPYTQLDKGKGIRASEFLVQQGIDYLVLREATHGRGPEYVLRDAGVEVANTDRERLDDVIRELGLRPAMP